ncbi:hypothetical protein [Mucilaginibacter sp. NFX135]|uniref:hypothetical protein n=1 Tax=Mucilaginibacter sp. NFX135 TaxID=3402687 RepID=UPI003AFA5A8B
MLKYLTINTGSELICLLVALVCVTRARQAHWRSMTAYMLLVCIAELAGIYVEYSIPGTYTRNEWIYNLLLIAQAGLINWMFNQLLKAYLPMSWIITSAGVLLLVLYGYEILDHGIAYYNQLTNTVMLVFISLFSLLYYYFLIRDTRYVSLARHADFWWVTGIFFFYFGTTACNVFYHQLAPGANNMIKHLTYYIYNAFIFVLYGCWSYSFICKKWEVRTLPA